MPYTPIPPLPAVPDANDGPETFTDDADQFLGALPGWTDAINASGDYIDAVGVQVDADKIAADASATAAASSATAALASQNLAAASADYKGLWSAQTGAANKPYSVFHNGSFWALNVNLANVTTQEPSLTNANWQFISGTRWQNTRTANFTVAQNAYEQVTATSGVVVATLPTLVANSFICVANNPDSTQLVRISKAGVTVRSNILTIASGDDITLRPGQVFYAYAINSTNLRVPNNG
jgi:hypothetical protein